MRHIMVDIESLGTQPGSVILSIGAVVFGKTGMGETFYRNINILSQLLAGLTTDPETIAWWAKQSGAARGSLFPGQVSLFTALTDFTAFVKRDDCLWAKGPDFDMMMINEAYRALGTKPSWSFRNTRDVRTILAIGKNLDLPSWPPMDERTKHHALHDAEYQALQVTEVLEKLGTWQL